jgi:hypothetical protein
MTGAPSTFELDPEELTCGGDAMGRLPDGRALFPHTFSIESLSFFER